MVGMLRDNGSDYDVVQNATKEIKGVPGLTCEIGLREGGGSKYIIDALVNNEDFGRTHIAIDPYGSIPYIQSETQIRQDGPYPNDMMKVTLWSLYEYIHKKDIDFLFFPLEDEEFFRRYSDGVPVYKNHKKELINTYALVFIDGPHNLESTMNEAMFFAPRCVPGSILVFDDVDKYYDHSRIKEYLLNNEFEEYRTVNTKAAYIKYDRSDDVEHSL